MTIHSVSPEEASPIRHLPEIEYTKLSYLTEMLEELRKLAEDLDERTLNYLIEMAMLESNQRMEQVRYQNDILV